MHQSFGFSSFTGLASPKISPRADRRVLCGNGLHDLVAQTLAEAVEHTKDQGGGHQADQDHSHRELLDHQQVDPQWQRAKVDQAEETHQKARNRMRRPSPTLLHGQVARQGVQAGRPIQAQHAHRVRGLRLSRDFHDCDDEAVGGAVGLLASAQTVGRQKDLTSGCGPALTRPVLVSQNSQNVAVILKQPDFLVRDVSLVATEGAADDAWRRVQLHHLF